MYHTFWCSMFIPNLISLPLTLLEQMEEKLFKLWVLLNNTFKTKLVYFQSAQVQR